MRILSLVLLVLLAWLQYLFWFGKNNFSEYREIRREIVSQQQENNQLKQRNERQFAEIRDLAEGERAIEERARTELGMIKKGEHFYRIITDNKD